MRLKVTIVKLQELGVDFTFAWDNYKKNNNNKNPYLYFLKRKNGLKSKKRLKIDLQSIFNHEGGTRKFRVTAQNKAIYISFQMI